jgi:hypothetical protein
LSIYPFEPQFFNFYPFAFSHYFTINGRKKKVNIEFGLKKDKMRFWGQASFGPHHSIIPIAERSGAKFLWEALDLVIDSRSQKVTPNPAHDGKWVADLY